MSRETVGDSGAIEKGETDASGSTESASSSAPTRADQVQEVYLRLRDLIVRGRMAPGSRLVEADLADRLNVSRTPVRSALLKLKQEGYVAAAGHRRQSRLSVTPVTSEDGYELWWIVAAIEGVAGRWAALLEPEKRVRLVARLREINDELIREADKDTRDPNRIFELDSLFHRTFVRANAGARLLAFHDSIKPQTERYGRLYTGSIVDEIEVSAAEHEAIIQAIERGDPDTAEAAARYNWQRSADRLVRVIESLGEMGHW